MSILSVKTERNALRSIAKTLRFFDELAFCQMKAEDDAAITQAKNLLTGVIEAVVTNRFTNGEKGLNSLKLNSHEQHILNGDNLVRHRFMAALPNRQAQV